MNNILGFLTYLLSADSQTFFECYIGSYFQLTFIIVHQIVWLVYWGLCNDSDYYTVPVILSSLFIIISNSWYVIVTSLSEGVHPSGSQRFGTMERKLKKSKRKIYIFVSSGMTQVAFIVSNLIFIECGRQNRKSMNNYYTGYVRLQTIFIFIFAFGRLPFSIKIIEIVACSLIFELLIIDNDQECHIENYKCSYKSPRTFNIVIFHFFSTIFISYILYATIAPFYIKTVKAVVEYAKLTIRLNRQERQGLELIHSLVPPKLAAEVMKSSRSGFNASPSKSAFRDFYVAKMDEVSILFADIVGFTKMSSNKTAESLVDILNDLFGRFDMICLESGCEKISTLGDCYYCVAGCPEPRPDHANCCVTMGLLVCRAIVQFDEDRKEEVDMRVGVHSGSVLCGLVGTRRFKFDVWSHDVTLANEMESSGKPGRVHVSDATYQLVANDFQAEPGLDHPDPRGKKILVEEYNSELQKFIVRHQEESNYIKTWLIIDDLDKTKNIMKLEQINRLSVPMFKKVEVNGDNFTIDDQILSKYFLKLDNSKMKENKHYSDCSCFSLENNLEDDSMAERLRNILKISLLILFLLCQLIALSIQIDNRLVTIVLSILCLASILAVAVTMSLRLSLFSQLTFWCISHIKDIITHKCTSFVDNIFCIYFISLSIIIPISFFFASGSYHSNIDLILQLVVIEILPFLIWKTFYIVRLTLHIPITAAIILLVLYSDINYVDFSPFSANSSINSSHEFKLANMNYTDEFNNNSSVTIKMKYSNNICIIIELVLSLISMMVLVLIINLSIDKIKRIHNKAVMSLSVVVKESCESKEKEEWLLNNIVPNYVLKVLKQEGKYCRNINCVGIIFAKIANFDSFYDESFQGGIEFLRILNELIGDMEELFSEDRFRDIEKIKTIGSCLMAASGLNVEENETNDTPEHVYALVDFSMALLKKLSQFNANMLSFEFIMTIGYNIGQVTCGVVGLSKLLFDIWGDAVNVASRMYSTGVYGRVQLPENCYLILKDRFNFEYRGDIFVKGKGDMRTYLLVDEIK